MESIEPEQSGNGEILEFTTEKPPPECRFDVDQACFSISLKLQGDFNNPDNLDNPDIYIYISPVF